MENSVTPPAIRSETGKTGMLAFTIIWIGQMFSLLGTAMTQFALTIWAWGADWASYSSCFCGLLWFGTARSCQSLAGAIVDRYDRKKVMMLATYQQVCQPSSF